VVVPKRINNEAPEGDETGRTEGPQGHETGRNEAPKGHETGRNEGPQGHETGRSEAPEGDETGRKPLWVGTSGYSYKDWVGPFYPPGTEPSRYLELYAQEFSFTEINASYYRLPTSSMLRSMVERTPEGFLFSIKAHQSLTHKVEADWRRRLASFKRALEPLQENARLAGVLFQFPYSFHYEPPQRQYLADLLDEVISDEAKALRVFVEFRNRAWQTNSVYEGLTERGAHWVTVDLPPLERLPRRAPRVTAGAGYLRLHGRNSGNWWSGTNVSRYDYLYSAAELEELATTARMLWDESDFLLVAFNNHFEAQAVRNAQSLRAMLAG
jgi:uncharacterized protein YecE (DUF72 family)